jgi:ArsR family transcriptional regulator
MEKNSIQEVIKVFKTLSDPNRMKIIKILTFGPKCVHAIVRELKISQPAVSKHLKILTDSKLLESEKKGMYVHYSLNKDVLIKCETYLKNLSNKNIK